MSSNLPVRQHSELGASIAHRWIPCPGSVALSRGRPNYENEHSVAGTAAHTLGEQSLSTLSDPDVFLGDLIHVVGESGAEYDIEVTGEMADAVGVYTRYCRSLMEPGTKWWIENQFDLTSLGPPLPMFGTCDFAIYKPALRELEIVDLKYGSGVVVEVKGNKQTRYYALGAVIALGPGLEIDTIKMTIVQPRAGHPDGVVRSESMDYLDLLAFAGTLLDAARATLQPDAPLVPGSHCKFCPASAVCPAQRDHAQQLAQVAFSDMPLDVPPAPETLPPEILGDILSKLHVLEDWAASVRSHAKAELEQGREIPGVKLVEGKKGNRQWIDEDKAAQQLVKGSGLHESEIYKQPALKSPAQIEKLTGKKHFPAELVEQAPGKPVMVKDTDPRPALSLHPGDSFPALPAGE